MMQSGAEVYKTAFFSSLRPAAFMRLDEWADANRIVPYKPIEGKWNTDVTPYLREIMRELSPQSLTQEIVLKKAAQIGGTEVGYNWIYYIIAHGLGSVISCLPTDDLSNKMLSQKFEPTVDAMPSLKSKIRTDNKGIKSYPGGMAMFGGAGSIAKFRAVTVQYIHMPDYDGYPQNVGAEGSPVQLLRKRNTAFGRRKKTYRESTPTTVEESSVHMDYLASDQREYNVPCPECGELQPLVWERLHYEVAENGRVGNVYYRCKNNCVISERYKKQMLDGGEWIAKNPGHPTAGFYINALYLPAGWDGWHVLAQEHADAEKELKQGRDSAMRTFINTRLGLAYEGKIEKSAWEDLYKRREIYPAEVPAGVGVLTAGVDVQHDRVEMSVWGWGALDESWLITHQIFMGDPRTTNVFDLVDLYLQREFAHECGAMLPITCTFVDSGDQTKIVYEFCAGKEHRGIYPIKGENQYGKPAVSRSKNSGVEGVTLYRIGTDTLKGVIYAQLKIEGEGCGYCHFPYDATEEYFKQLCGESLQYIQEHGRVVRRWKKVYANVECLDGRVYAQAAAAFVKSLGVDIAALAEDYKNGLVVVGAQSQSNHARPKEHKQQENRRRW